MNATPRASAENPIGAAITKAVFGPDTAVGQMVLGCGKFYEQSGRWPRTREDVVAGLTAANLPSAKLDSLADLSLREDGRALVVDFISTENGRATGTITLHPPNA